MKVDLELLARHDRPGPRYTSYPTAVEFGDQVGAEEYRAALAEGRDRPLSLYVHLPYCRSLCHFCACNVLISSNRGKVAGYLDLLEREIELVAPHAGEGRPLQQLHWGGGTPSYLEPDQIEWLMQRLLERFPPARDAELSIEVDPRELDAARLQAIARAGFNRISMGVQDFDPAVQAAINRIQPEPLTRQAVEGARALGLQSVNLDLIYGLPHQTRDGFARTIDQTLALAPDRLALYSFAHLPWLKKHHTLIPLDALPAPSEKLAILALAVERLTAAGYRYIGMDHFARPDDELARALDAGTLYRNFQGYSTHAGCELVGLGLTAIGQLDRLYVQNHKTLPEYRAAIEAGVLPIARGVALDDDDRLRRAVIMAIMCSNALAFDEIEREFGVEFEPYFAAELAELETLAAEGLVERGPHELRLSEAGRLLVRNVALVFDRYRREARPGQRFSRTV